MNFKRKITPGRFYIPQMDGLRFIAIMAVIILHINTYYVIYYMPKRTIPVNSAWWLGAWGVQLFFVISGFLLAIPFAKASFSASDPPSLRKYYLRRLTRLEPPYIVAACSLFLLGAIIHHFKLAAPRWPQFSDWPHLLGSLFYQHDVLYGAPSKISVVFWSLEVEVQFYLLMPLFAKIFRLPGILARRTILLAVVVGYAWILRLPYRPILNLTLLGQLPWFAAGMLLADYYLRAGGERLHRAYAWDLASLGAWPAFVMILLSRRLLEFAPVTLLLAYLGALRGRVSSAIFATPALTIIGGMCYSIYLLHYNIISAVGYIVRPLLQNHAYSQRLPLLYLFMLPAIGLISTAYYLFLERPCMDPAWPQRLLRRFSRLRRAESLAKATSASG